MGVQTVLAPEGRSYPFIYQVWFLGPGAVGRPLDSLKTARIYLNSGLAMLADINVPKLLLTPFHKAFLNWKLHPTLEPALKESRTGERGKGRRARKMRVNGRGESQICLVFCKNFRLSVSESESSLVWREAQKTRGGFPFLGVAERVKLGPLEGWGTFLKDNQQFIRCFWNCLIDNYGLQRMWKQECCECL